MHFPFDDGRQALRQVVFHLDSEHLSHSIKRQRWPGQIACMIELIKHLRFAIRFKICLGRLSDGASSEVSGEAAAESCEELRDSGAQPIAAGAGGKLSISPPSGTSARSSAGAPRASRGRSPNCSNTRMSTFTSSDVASMFSLLSNVITNMFVELCCYQCLLKASAPFRFLRQLPDLRETQADPHAGVRALIISRAVADVPLCPIVGHLKRFQRLRYFSITLHFHLTLCISHSTWLLLSEYGPQHCTQHCHSTWLPLE